MISLLIFILASLGLTNAITQEVVFEWLRNYIDRVFPYSLLRKLIHCPTCMGFWCGIAIALIFPSLDIHWLLAGLISSISNKIVLLTLYKF